MALPEVTQKVHDEFMNAFKDRLQNNPNSLTDELMTGFYHTVDKDLTALLNTLTSQLIKQETEDPLDGQAIKDITISEPKEV